MTDPLDALRRQAKTLHKHYESGDRAAIARVDAVGPRKSGPLKRADFLHVIARENSFASWPQMKIAVETQGMDRAAKQQRLKIAIFHGQIQVVQQLMWDTPDLADGNFGLQVAMFDLEAVRATLAADPAAATRAYGPRRPILHLAFSKMLQAWPEREADMLAIAKLLLSHGADVNDGFPHEPGSDHKLSALYGAIGHAGNIALGRWLLEHGADPNDNESLYHATELGHHEGLKLLLAHGAAPKGTNALLRAMDFHDVGAVRMLLDAGADPNEFAANEVGGEAPWVVPALFQAARRHARPEMIELLLDAGADPARRWRGASAYAAACVFGNDVLRRRLEELGPMPALSEAEQVLADCVRGHVEPGRYLEMDKVPPAFGQVLREVLWLPGRQAHVEALIAVGVPWDAPDTEGLTPVQVAGWEGLPEMVAYFLKLGPDLSHVNGFGGTLLSTIIHGSENCPDRAERDYLTCLKLVLEHGVALPKRAAELAGEPEVADFLADWAVAHPGQVVEHGVV
ncbi:ankyrin repeat domain-containing protein [Cognatiyoonia sp. IB215446]|uniref:ankyrin repeat domain-containing protein n=1 Tax=Cognatiyoonia sp. IB215446 TaxID=3097355 RepID=UPI002A0E317F|nr:ankyrin repeat domain-containing protein [Cognatiyoonia sp. IB215446]MDX8347192.1 ankyrin repeat domain-containing protein [Cognatiyoonia sp. IB215446]